MTLASKQWRGDFHLSGNGARESSHNDRSGARYRVRTCDIGAQNQGVTEAVTQTRTHEVRGDSELQEVVGGWPDLPSALKAAVLAIVYSHRATTHNERTTNESAANCRPVRPEDDKQSASDDQQVTKRSAESVPPRAKGFDGTGRRAPPLQLWIRAERG
jgi:hypothetical protein